ncbi:MAG: VOC family protein [Alphaproteobacteria bacterium]|nr:VOC family protein [Alphaproteobacteria bacterium]
MNGKGEGTARKARVLGINHVVLEVGDLDEALDFYGAIFDFTLRGRGDHNAFIGMGDQFIQLTLNKRDGGPDTKRHFGLVVDDRDGVAEALEAAGAERVGERLNFRDPWGNRIEVVSYAGIQFTKADHVLKGMGVGAIEKNEEAVKELTEAGMAPPKA